MVAADEEKIRTLAHRLWEEAGSPPDGDRDFWYAAEKLLADEGEAPDPDEPIQPLPVPGVTPRLKP
jgi:hypothetical protein